MTIPSWAGQMESGVVLMGWEDLGWIDAKNAQACLFCLNPSLGFQSYKQPLNPFYKPVVIWRFQAGINIYIVIQ